VKLSWSIRIKPGP